MKFCYADPPYPGQAKRLYGCAEVDYPNLIRKLDREFDGWALSMGAKDLRHQLFMCPAEGIRVGAWVKPFHVLKGCPSYGWEPVLFKTSRKRDKSTPLPKDWCSANMKMVKGFNGAKPEEFCFWIFELLGMTPADDFVDPFHGTGAVKDAHKKWCENYPEILFRHWKPGPRKRFEVKNAESRKEG